MNAKEIVSIMKGHWMGQYGSVKCPCHDDRNPSLTVGHSTSGEVIVHCLAGCDWRDVKATLNSLGYLPEASNANVSALPTKQELSAWREEKEKAERKRTDAARRLWSKTLHAKGSLVETYLKNRSINASPPPTIRYLPNARHSPTGLNLPAMVAVVSRWPSREIDGIHRTYLTEDGRKKSPVSQNKMMLGVCRGGAVRLMPAASEMIVTEGIETGLSVMAATAKAVWCGLSAGGIENLFLPELPLAQSVIIAADNDPRGLVAAQVAAEKWSRAGRSIRITTPPIEGQDFNDVAMGGAA
jgi:putative DNA primase/helicase